MSPSPQEESDKSLSAPDYCSDGSPEHKRRCRKPSNCNQEIIDDIRQDLRRDESGKDDTKSLPDPTKDADPLVFLKQMVEAICGYSPTIKRALELKNFFPEVSEEQIAAYDLEMLTACRENDVSKVKELYNNGEGKSVDCYNRFGEGLLHLACRRGFVELGIFLMEEAQLPVRIREDCGRTPLHDVMWNPKPQLELAKALITRDPALLLVSDKRGHTPFEYTRPEHWSIWRQFLFDNRADLKSLGNTDAKALFS
jgi:hypothetical protein